MSWFSKIFGGQGDSDASGGGEQSPRTLYKRFFNGRKGEDIVNAANAIETCLRKRDQSSSELMELLKPKVQMPATGPTGRPLMDLTGGRPDTPQWIALRIIVEQENSYYDEYMSWIRRNSAAFNRTWIRAILEHLSTSSQNERVRAQCKECLGHL